MVHHERGNGDSGTNIREAVAAILAQRGWRLLSEEELVHRVESLLHADSSRNTYWAIISCYAQELHSACTGSEGDERQEQGFDELYHYLYDVSWKFSKSLPPDERAEVTNQAAADLYYRLVEPHEAKRRPGVRNPSAFLMVAAQQLRNIIRKWRKDVRADWNRWVDQREAYIGGGPEQLIVDREIRQRVQQCFVDALQRHPRARLQLWVVWMRHIEGLDYPAISTELKMTIPNVRVLYSRGLGQLRKDPDWHDLGRDLGMV